jgi:adenine-specific DNA methylase
VHDGELSLFFRAWAGLPVETLDGEAVANSSTGINTDTVSYAASLERIFSEVQRTLREQGRLVFSYANHEPEAWIGLFSALQAAGFHAVACVSVHAENETDFKKRGINACTDDLLLELSPSPFAGEAQAIGVEQADPFATEVARWFKQVGALQGEWKTAAARDLQTARRLVASNR